MFVFTLSKGLYYTILSFQKDLSRNLSIYSWTVSQNFHHTKLSLFTVYRGSQFIWLRKPEYPEHGTVLIVLNYSYSWTCKIKHILLFSMKINPLLSNAVIVYLL